MDICPLQQLAGDSSVSFCLFWLLQQLINKIIIFLLDWFASKAYAQV